MEPRDALEKRLLTELERLKERISGLTDLENKVEVLEDLVRGDVDRNMLGLINEFKHLSDTVEEVLEDRRELKVWDQKWTRIEQFMKLWNERELMVKGAFWLIASSGGLSILTFVTTVLGLGG